MTLEQRVETLEAILIPPPPQKLGATPGERIRRLREHVGLNQTQLARKAEVEKSTLSRLENGKMITAGNLHRIAQALGVSMDYLWTGMEVGK